MKVESSVSYSSSTRYCYFAVELHFVFTTRQLLPATKKDVFPAFHNSNIIYQCLCHSDSWCVGHTSLRFKQHAPKSIKTGQFSKDRSALSGSCKFSNHSVSHDSAVGQHLVDTQLFALQHNNNRFSYY